MTARTVLNKRRPPTKPSSSQQLADAAPDLLNACLGLLECAETGVTSLGTMRMARAAVSRALGDARRIDVTEFFVVQTASHRRPAGYR